MRSLAPTLILVAVLISACGEDSDADAEKTGSFSPVTISSGDTVDLHTPQGWTVTDYSASGLIAETEEDAIYAMIDPSRMDGELLMAAGSDNEKYEQYQTQLYQGGMVNILFTPKASCAELLAEIGDSRGKEFDSEFLDHAVLETVDAPATEDFSAYKLQSVRGLVSLGDGMCVATNFSVFDPDPDRGSDLVKQIAAQSRMQQ